MTSHGVVFLAGWLALANTVLAGRIWVDNTGRYRVEAELVEVKDGVVWLEKDEGKSFAVPLDRLSEADRTYLDSLGGKTPQDKASDDEATNDSSPVDMPKQVAKYLDAAESYKQSETQRLSPIAKAIRKELARPGPKGRCPRRDALKEALRQSTKKLNLLRGNAPVVPQLSVRSLAEGQIGVFEKDQVFSVSNIAGPDSMLVTFLVCVVPFQGGTTDKERGKSAPGAGRPSSANAINRDNVPDLYLWVKGIATDKMRDDWPDPAAPVNFDPKSRLNVAMQNRVFQVFAKQEYPAGVVAFVIKPFDMKEVNAWLDKTTGWRDRERNRESQSRF